MLASYMFPVGLTCTSYTAPMWLSCGAHNLRRIFYKTWVYLLKPFVLTSSRTLPPLSYKLPAGVLCASTVHPCRVLRCTACTLFMCCLLLHVLQDTRTSSREIPYISCMVSQYFILALLPFCLVCISFFLHSTSHFFTVFQCRSTWNSTQHRKLPHLDALSTSWASLLAGSWP